MDLAHGRINQKTRRVFAIKIVLLLIEVTVERCDNFAHPAYTSFSPETDVSYRAVLQVAALRDAVREASDRRVF
jgi:hypothetical protein